MEFLNIDTISVLQNHLSNLTGLYLALYGEKGNLILPLVSENKILSAIRSSPKGRDEYNDFIKKNVENVLRRNDVSLFKGPAGQCHFFAPLRNENLVFILIGGGIFLSQEDFSNFHKGGYQQYDISTHQIQSLVQEITIQDRADILDTARHIQSIYNLVLKDVYAGNLNEKRYRLMKTILNLISDIKLEKQEDEIYDILVDAMLFLFNADSISIMMKDKNTFRAKRTAGRLRDSLLSQSFNITGLISELVESAKPLYTDAAIDILHLGLNDEITSMYVFPILMENKVTGILGIFNTALSQEEVDIIAEICKIAGCILKLIDLKVVYTKCIKEIDILNLAAERLNPVKEPDLLYEAILDTSVHLTEAEKGSLMLIEDGSHYLTVKAAVGINRRLLGEIKVKIGEGVAGWVFKEGVPLKVDDVEKIEKISLRRRSHYKTGSFISIPLKMGMETIGVLNISDKITGEVFSEDDMILLRSFASYATIAMERSNYYSLAGHLKELSITDSLTGLFNRRYFEERFFEEIHRSSRHNLSFSFAMIDIDDFKLFNDTEGHLAGDEILKSIANISKECLRVIDVIARFGGEEFAVIMPQTDKDEAFLVAERIRNSVKDQLHRTWHSFPKDNITITIGISTFPYDGKDRKEMIRNADRALYRGKMEGKNRTVFWES